MALRWARFKYGKILANMHWDDNFDLLSPRQFIISVHGLPSHPYQLNSAPLNEYLRMGFVIILPEYIGTWGSYGINTLESCVDTILETIQFLKKGKAQNLLNGKNVAWKVKEIILLGGSFGGSVALIAGAKSKAIRKIIAVAPPTDYRTHNKKYHEEDLNETWQTVKKGFENLWRLDKKYFDKLQQGKIDLNPVDYVNELKRKNVLLVHGENDKSVSIKRSIELLKLIKSKNRNSKLIALKGEGHLGNDVIGKSKLFKEISRWLKK